MLENQPQQLRLIIDLDERGSFHAHVEDENDSQIFAFSNEDEKGNPDPNGLWLVYDGFMKNSHDINGLLGYLRDIGLASQDSTMILES